VYTRLLYAHDGSTAADMAIPHVAAIVAATGAEVLIAHIVRPLGQQLTHLAPGAGWMATPTPVIEAAQDLLAYERAAALNQLHAAAGKLRELGVESVRVEVVEGSPDEAILALASAERCDAIVIGTRGESGFRRMMHGSVAERVVVHSRLPVLVVGPDARPGSHGSSGADGAQIGTGKPV
jgi:nucleotide-binding universal stress UspA family protein